MTDRQHHTYPLIESEDSTRDFTLTPSQLRVTVANNHMLTGLASFMADFSQQIGPDWPEQVLGANTYPAQPLVALHLASHAALPSVVITHPFGPQGAMSCMYTSHVA